MLGYSRVARSRPREVVGDSQPSFAGGLNTVSNDYSMRPDQMRRSDNVRLNNYGAATKRGGLQRTAAALDAASVRGGYGWRQGSSTFYTLAMCNGSLSRTVYSAYPLTWTSLGGSFSAGVAPSFAAFRDASANAVYIATGGALKKYDGTTLSTCANAKQATGICVYHDRLWGWGVSGSLDSVFYSQLSGATVTTGGDSLGYAAGGGGQIVVRTFGQEDVVACAPVNTSLIIWHKRGMSRLTGFGNSDITVSPEIITADVGLVGQGALCVNDNIAYFVSERGVYKANEATVMPLGTTEKPDPVAPVLLTLDSSNLPLVKCAYNRATSELWIQVPGIGVYVYQTIVQSWSGPFVDGYVSPDTTCLIPTLDASGQPIMMRGDASGFVSLCDAPTVRDNVVAAGTGGAAFSAAIQCHRMFCGNPMQANGYRWIRLLAKLLGSTLVNISWSTLSASDSYQLSSTPSATTWGSTGTTWGTGTWGAGGGQSPMYIPCSGTGTYIDVTISDDGQACAEYAAVQVEGFVYGER